MTWQEELRHSIHTAEALCAALGLSETEIPVYRSIVEHYPMMIPPYYLSLIDPRDPADPIARICVPSPEELEPSGVFDTSGEGDNTKQEGVQHKYAQTALILSTNVLMLSSVYSGNEREAASTASHIMRMASSFVLGLGPG